MKILFLAILICSSFLFPSSSFASHEELNPCIEIAHCLREEWEVDNIINKSKNNLHCKVNFEIDGIDYYIEKVGKKNLRNGHVKVNIDFWMIDDSGDQISLNGDQRRTTQKNIQKVIGNFDDFNLTSMSSQNNSTVFIDKTQKERKELLSQFMGLKIFDTLYQYAAEEIKEVNALLTDFKKADYDSELAQITNDLITLEGKQKEYKKDESKLKHESKNIRENIQLQTKRLKPVDSTLKPIDDLNNSKKSLTTALDEAVKEYDKKSNELHDMKISMDDVNTKIQSYMNDGVNEQYLELEKLEKERDLFQIEIDKLKIEVRAKLDKIEKLGDLTWNEDCAHCMSNPFTLDAIETKKNLNKDKVLAQEYVTKKQLMEDEINKKFKVRAYKKDLDELKGQYLHFQTDSQFLESGVELLQEKQKRINNNLNVVLSDIEKSKRQEKDVLFNT